MNFWGIVRIGLKVVGCAFVGAAVMEVLHSAGKVERIDNDVEHLHDHNHAQQGLLRELRQRVAVLEGKKPDDGTTEETEGEESSVN